MDNLTSSETRDLLRHQNFLSNLSINHSSDMDDSSQTERCHGDALCFVTNVVIDGTLNLVGLFCNILCVIVLQRDTCKMSMTILLQGLALSDALFLGYSFIYTSLRSVYPFTGTMYWIYHKSPYIIAYLLPVGWISQTCTIWMIVCVAFDRYIMICKPFRARNWCTVKNAQKAVVVIWLAAILFNAPRFLYYHHVAFTETNINYDNTTGNDGDSPETFVAHVVPKSDVWRNYRMIYHTIISLIFLYIIPLPLLTVINIRLLIAITSARKQEKVLARLKDKKERETHAVTLNLVIVVSVFIVCQTPDFVASIITMDSFNINCKFLHRFLCIRETLLVFNASINFVIYCLFYKRFRLLLRRLICTYDKALSTINYSKDSFSSQNNIRVVKFSKKAQSNIDRFENILE